MRTWASAPERWLVALSTLVLAMAGGGASSAWAATASFPLSVSDCQTATQFCEITPTVAVQTVSQLLVEFVASPGHCSPVIAHIQVDGVEQFVSGALDPGETTGVQDLGPVSPGLHTIGVLIEGVVGGCNQGLLLSWSGTLTVTTDAATAVPTLAEWAQLLLLALLIGGGLLAIRRFGGSARPA